MLFEAGHINTSRPVFNKGNQEDNFNNINLADDYSFSQTKDRIIFRNFTFRKTALINGLNFMQPNLFSLENCKFLEGSFIGSSVIGTNTLGTKLYPEKLTAVNKTLYTNGLFGLYNLAKPSISLDAAYGLFKIQGDNNHKLVRMAPLQSVDANLIPHSFAFSGVVKLIATDSIVITAYEQDSVSNFTFSDTLLRGQIVEYFFDPLETRGRDTIQVIDQALGSSFGTGQRSYARNDFFPGLKLIIPGTVSIRVGSITFTDDGFGNLTGDDGSVGTINYIGEYVQLILTNPLVTTQSVLLSCQYYDTPHIWGMWKKIRS